VKNKTSQILKVAATELQPLKQQTACHALKKHELLFFKHAN